MQPQKRPALLPASLEMGLEGEEGLKRLMDASEGHQDVGGGQDGVAFHPAAFGVGPAAVALLQVEQFLSDVRAPVDHFAVLRLDEVHIRDGEGLAHRVVVIVDALGTESGVLFDRVVVLEPLQHGLHARVVLVETCVNKAE